MPQYRLLSRLRRAEEALPRREMNLNELSDPELEMLERYLRRAQEIGPDGALAEMSKPDRLEFEAAASNVKYEWRRLRRGGPKN